jgi:branched-chain amino acid transport system substrate-binding protein
MRMPRTLPALALALAVGACKPQPTTPAPDSKPALPPVKIGLLLPLTGVQASFGEDAIGGARLAADEINMAGGIAGRPLELLIRDSASLAETIPGILTELAADPALVAVVGEVASARTLDAARVAQELGLPLVVPAATHPAVTTAGPFVFRTCYTEPFQGAAMARFAFSIGAVKAAVLAVQGDPYSEGLASSFREAFVGAGGQVVADVAIPSGTQDFAAQLTEVKNAAPEVVFLPVYFSEAARVIRQAREMGIEAPFLGGDGWDSPEFLREGAEAVENCYAANHFSAGRPVPAVETFSKAYEAAKGAPPPPLAALAYDAVKVTAAAAATAADRAAVREALAVTSGFPGVTGTITFDATRNTTKPAIILRVEGGRFTYLETVEP